MSNFSDYAQYRKQKPYYQGWKDEREQKLANKVQYIKTNPVDKDEFNNDVERAKVILNAVNVMDEYSQSRAEEMEQVSESAIGLAAEPVAFASMGLAALTLKLCKANLNDLPDIFKNNPKNLKRFAPAFIVYMLPAFVFSVIGQIWAVKNEIKASREGRKEAMDNDLASVKQFAILNESQMAQVEELSKNIHVDPKDSKKIIQKENKLGIIQALKTIFKRDNSEKYLADVKINKNNLSEKQILEAKKDKDLIQNIVEKIDISSQEYAEDTENAINIFTTIASTGGILSGLLASYLVKNVKSLAKHKNLIGYLIGGGITLGSIIYGSKIQKQASRVARFKVKQDLMNNPEQLVYVDEEKYKNQNAKLEEEKKQGFFKNIIKIAKENKEYNAYIKENNAKNIKLMKAKEQIELTQEQEKRAEQLQQNVFNMFNKLDEKSQRYSESAEAMGSIAQAVVSGLITLPGIIGSMLALSLGKSKNMKILGVVGYFASIISGIGLNFIITKDQKNASRVANMEAISELNDYRYFASSYIDNNGKQDSAAQTNKNMSPALQKLLKK